MKVTKEQLRQIIKEEFTFLNHQNEHRRIIKQIVSIQNYLEKEWKKIEDKELAFLIGNVIKSTEEVKEYITKKPT